VSAFAVWLSRIALQEVVRKQDLKKLLLEEHTSGKEDCFNGIAFDTATGDYYFTGKNWQKMYRAVKR
jgi:glutamine cyclotransferase